MEKRQFIVDMREAIRSGNGGKVTALLTENPEWLTLETTLGTWLHTAARAGQLGVVRLLVEKGLDVDVVSGPAAASALNDAAGEGHADVVEYLLEHGASLDTSEPERNPLFAAIHHGHLAIAKRILDAGIDFRVSYTGERMKDMDALAFAREWGRTDIAELLIARGA